jgi:CO/xanthine dehydrogenase FAD-binding subunit
MTALAPNEMVTEVRLPTLLAGTGSAYAKHKRIEGGFAIVGVAAVLSVRGGRCQSISVGVSGGGAIPFRLHDVESLCQGKTIDEQLIDDIAEAAYSAATAPSPELHASADYKRAMVRVFTRRAVQAALARAIA